MCDQVVLLLVSPLIFAGAFCIVAFFADGIAEPVRRVDFFAGVAATKSYFLSAVWAVDNLVHVI